VTVPYVAVYPDYEYYGGYYYGPTFVFRYYGGDFHSRSASRAVTHSRSEFACRSSFAPRVAREPPARRLASVAS
jgi:hypothetical protein